MSDRHPVHGGFTETRSTLPAIALEANLEPINGDGSFGGGLEGPSAVPDPSGPLVGTPPGGNYEVEAPSEVQEIVTAPTVAPIIAPAKPSEDSDELGTIRSALKTVQDELDTVRGHVSAREAHAQRDLASSQDALRTAETHLRNLTEDLERERTSRQRSEEFATRVRSSLDESQARLNALTEELTFQTEARQKLEMSLGEADRALAARTDDARASSTALTDLQDQLARKGEELAALQQQLSEAETRISSLTAEAENRNGLMSQAAQLVTTVKDRLAVEVSARETLRQELATANERVSSLERENGELRARPSPTVTVPAAKVTPPTCVPVAFMAPDGRSVAKEVLFAAGKGEALEGFLDDTIRRWTATGLPLVPLGGSVPGMSLALKGDPEKRAISFLHTGVVLVRLSRAELAEVSDLPPVVTRRRA